MGFNRSVIGENLNCTQNSETQHLSQIQSFCQKRNFLSLCNADRPSS